MNLEVNTTITYGNQNDSPTRVTHHIGGTRSGKTYALLQWCIVQALSGKETITIVRKTLPSAKRTVMKDFKDVMLGLGIWNENDWNTSDRIYTFYTESVIQFISTDDAEKLRGLKSSILWLEEANEIDEDSYFQLSIRTTGPIILSYNPTISPYHWIRLMQDCTRYFTTYKNNPYLEKTVVKAIEELQKTNPKAWLVYGLGEYVSNEKAIFQFNVVDFLPDEATFIAFGLDFGYSSDPTALVSVWKMDNELYIMEHCYEKGMVTSDIDNMLKSVVKGREEIWADSAEPRLIDELYRLGWNIRPVIKGKDSSDRFGKQLDKPVDFNNHLIDAARYACMMRLSNKATAQGKYIISVR